MNKIVFTAWHIVNIINSEKDKEPMKENKFLAIMARNYKTKNYGVFYDPNDYSFSITYQGENYQVILPTEVKASLKTKNRKKLALDLLKLALDEKKYNDAVEAEKNYERRLKEIETSGYDALETTEDYEFYLNYLNNKAKKTKNEEEKELINCKIRGILKNIANPYNLTFHFNRLICDVASQGKELDDSEKQELEQRLRAIADDYYVILSNFDKGLVNGSSIMPMDIVRRIEETEYLVSTWLNNKKTKEEIEVEKEANLHPTIEEKEEDELGTISESLQEMLGRGKR